MGGDVATAWALALLNVVGGIVTVMIGVRSRSASLRRSLLIGVRTPTTLRHHEAWTAAQMAAGPMEVLTGMIMVAGGATALVILVRRPVLSVAVSIFTLLAAIAFGIVAYVIGARAGRIAADGIAKGPR